MKVQRLLAAALAAALLLSGCTSLSLSGPDILAPPKAAGHRAEIQSMIEKDSGGAYSLIYPASGSYKSGIIMHDTDGDGADESVALYTAADGTPRLLTASEQDGHYKATGVIQLRSANVTGLDFADFNADGTEELVICFDGSTPLSSLAAYIGGENLTEIGIAEGFTDYVTGDFDGNSAADILLLTPADGKNPAQASLTVYGEDGFSEKSSCEVDPSVVSYAQLSFDYISEDIKGAIADGNRDSGEYTTQLLYYDSAAHMLVNPLYLNSSYAESARTCAVTSADIDGDGVIEVPLCTLTEHAKDEDPEAVCSRARWSGYDPELMTLAFKQDSLLCEKLGFMLCLEPEVLDAITARYTAENAVTLYNFSYKNNEPVLGGELLTVKRNNKNSYDSSLTAEADLYESTAYIYTYVLNEGSPFTHDDIENSFTLLNAE